MFWNQVILYMRENQITIELIAGAILLLLLLVILFQVSRTRREVHKICKKIRRYFDVILTEPAEKEPVGQAGHEVLEKEVPICRSTDSLEKSDKEPTGAERIRKEQNDAKLLMDIIQEVF